MAWRPSCAHDATSASSSSVPSPPGRAMKPSARAGHLGLALVERLDDAQLGQAGVCQLAIDQPARDDADDLAAGRQRRVGDGAHHADAAAAVDDADPALGEPGPDRARELEVGADRDPGSRRRRRRSDGSASAEAERGESRRHPPGGPGAVRDRVLLGRRPQPERPAAGRLRGGLEDRVVAEPAVPRGSVAIRPRHVPRAVMSGTPPRGPASPGRASARTQT